jgi:hypothetical protein
MSHSTTIEDWKSFRGTGHTAFGKEGQRISLREIIGGGKYGVLLVDSLANGGSVKEVLAEKDNFAEAYAAFFDQVVAAGFKLPEQRELTAFRQSL